MDEGLSRAAGTLYGLAVGDALGMPTQSLPRSQVVARYGALLATFEPAPPGHPLAAGMPAGAVTDDTEQALLLAGLLIERRGRVDPAELAVRLLAWEESMRERGSADLLGPSTRQALAALLAGADIEQAGRRGVTNGAAMRIAPVGVATPSADLDVLVDRVVEASRITHNTGVALAGAAAVAAAVSAGVDGATVPEATALAVVAARRAAGRGHWVAAADVVRPDRLGHRAGRRALARGGGVGRLRPRGHQPGHPGVGPGRVRRAGGQPRRPLAGLQAGRVAGRRLRHHRRDGRSHRRGVSRREGLPGERAAHRRRR